MKYRFNFLAFFFFLLTFTLNNFLCFSEAKQNSNTKLNAIYGTCADFLNNQYKFYAPEGVKIHFRFNIASDNFVVSTPDTLFSILHGSIYGYQFEGNQFRYYNPCKTFDDIYTGYYKIEEKGTLIIYSLEIKDDEKIYFSTDHCSKILKLTNKNLEKTFQDNPQVLNAIRKNGMIKKNTDAQLSTGLFLINYVLNSLNDIKK